MKLKLFLSSIAGMAITCGVLTWAISPGKAAQTQSINRHDVLILQAYQVYERVGTNYGYKYHFPVTAVSRSAGAPEFPVMVWNEPDAPFISEAQAMAELLDAGFKPVQTTFQTHETGLSSHVSLWVRTR